MLCSVPHRSERTPRMSIKTIPFVFFIFAISSYAYGIDLKTLKHCCGIGTVHGESGLPCSNYRTPFPNVDKKDESLCTKSVDVCCKNKYRENQCSLGQDDAMNRKDCKNTGSISADDVRKDCCEACQLGIETGMSGQSCSILPGLGSPYDNAFTSCCRNKDFVKHKSTPSALKQTTVSTSPTSSSTTPRIPDDNYPPLENICEITDVCAQICIPTLDSYRCDCQEGYALMADGVSCKAKKLPSVAPPVSNVPVDRCDENNPCEHECKDTGISIQCSCYEGFELDKDKVSCNDIDECKLGLHECLPSQTCINEQGSYNCGNDIEDYDMCPEGYVFNAEKKACDDFDECQFSIVCENHQTCVNTVGGFECKNKPVQCPPGFFFKDSIQDCEDIDECILGHHDCNTASQMCLNTKGNFTCIDKTTQGGCPPGFKKNSITFVCEDINECEENEELCGPNEICVNESGGHTCVPQTKANAPPRINPYDYPPGMYTTPKVTPITLPTTTSTTTIRTTEATTSSTTQFVYSSVSNSNKWPHHPLFPIPSREPERQPSSSNEPRYPETRHSAPSKYSPHQPSPPSLDPEPQPSMPSRYSPQPSSSSRDPEPQPSVPSRYSPQPSPSSRDPEPQPSVPSRYSPQPSPSSRDPEPQPSVPSRYSPQPSPSSRDPEPQPSVPSRYSPQPSPPSRDPEPQPPAASRYSPQPSPSSRDPEPQPPVASRYSPQPSPPSRDREPQPSMPSNRPSPTPHRESSHKPQYVPPYGPRQLPISCQSGFKYSNEFRTCVDINECHEEDTCDSTQDCINTHGSYYCNCKRGFSKDITGACVDINECQLGTHDCTEGQRCDNTIGSYYCPRTAGCGTGYTLNHANNFCEDDDECALGTDNCKDLGSQFQCKNTLGSYRCERIPRPFYRSSIPLSFTISYRPDRQYNPNLLISQQKKCLPGYIMNSKGDCEDIDECKTNPCARSERCLNLNGRYQCISKLQCKLGFELNEAGNECVDIDECARGTHQCSSTQICKNGFGYHVCTCPPGHQLNVNNHCEDINECEYYRGRACSNNAECINTIGSFECRCHEGLRQKGRDLCDDIDECNEIPGLCQQKCVNLWGNYRCSCDRGYSLNSDNRTCSDIDECEKFKDQHLCIATCQNTPGSYACSCPSGYRLGSDGRTCQDIDECHENVCGRPDATCLNTRGGYKCFTIDCPPSYIRDPEHKSRCKRAKHVCDQRDHRCLEMPQQYSYHFMTFISNLPILHGHIDFFQMRGPVWPGSATEFNMQIVNVTCPQGIERVHGGFFRMNTMKHKAILALIRPIEGPQEIELQLELKLYYNHIFNSKMVAKIFLIVSQYPF